MRIRLVDIAKDFGRTGALRGTDLEILDGELIALLGPSGSGKTTLLRVIAGLEVPNSGRVFFDDQDATGMSVQRRRIGFVFQNYALFKHMSASDNIAYGLRVLPRAERLPSVQVRKRVRELLALVQLSDLGARYPRQLSGGQQQRVALARALAVEPRVLLLDEPFGALDAKVRKDLRRWLRELHNRIGRTTVFVTHDQEEALELADRVAILNRGKVEQVGKPDEIYDSPATSFVMSFVGDTTSLPVKFDGVRLLYEGQPITETFGATQNGPCRLFVRPRDIAVSPLVPGQLTGRIVSIHRTAAGRRAEIAVEGGRDAVEAEIDIASKLSPGEQVRLNFLKGRVFSE